jgi:kinetochore protein Fta7
VPRIPFPPKTDEAFFDYEATLNRTVDRLLSCYGAPAKHLQRVLEAQLTADLHSASLLKAEIKKERRLLEGDKEELQQLEKALRDEEARRQRHSKGLHPLAKIGEAYTGRLRTVEEGPRLPCSIGPSFRDLEDDTNLEDLLEQLHSHLESMQNNTGSIAEIPLAMTTSQRALDCFLWRFLDKEKYAKLHGMDMT